jgi:hypothetical protein
MRRLKIAGLILAGMLAISSTAFAHGFGGGGHFGGGGGGHFSGGGHFGGGHYGASHFGGHYGWQGGHGYGGHWYGGHWYGGGYYPYYGVWGYPYGWGWDYPYYGDSYGYYDGTAAYAENAAPDNGYVVAAQKELAKLGYYHGAIDGVAGPETAKAIRWFQSVDKIPVTGQLDDQTLQALQIG